MAVDYDAVIEQAISGPKSATVDGTSATARDVEEILKAEDRLKTKQASRRNHLGLIFRQISPGGGGL